jgi:signal transduction histidine kinase/ligand-binding sensor domain-containing protein
MIGPLHRIALGAFVLVLGLPLRSMAGGPREFTLQTWTREDGLPGSSVTAVAQTSDGYLWVSTFSELARFDGVRFKVIPLEGVQGLGDSPVVHLYADRKGSLWIGTLDGHLVRLRDGRFTPVQLRIEGTPLPYGQNLAEAADGKLWALNGTAQLYGSVGEGFQPWAPEPATNRDGLTGLAADRFGGIWLTRAGVLLRATNGSPQVVWDTAREPGFNPEAIAPAQQGGCWVAANDRVRRFLDGQCVETRGPFAWKHTIWGFLEDRDGNVWLGTYGGGLTALGGDGSIKSLARAEGLPSDMVRCLNEDREGNLWAGFEGKGLARVRRAMFSSYGRTEGLSGEVLLCACEGAEGEMWLGSNGKGIMRLQGGQLGQYGEQEGLGNEFVWALRMDRAGILWAGTWGGGLFRLEGERFVNAGAGMGLSSIILALHEDRHGSLWLGQQLPRGRLIEAIIPGRKQSLKAPGTSPGIDVRAIAETPDGALYFGTSADGLLRWNGTAFRQFGSADGLPPGGISTMLVDRTGALWLGVTGCGLVLWQGEHFAPITMAEGLPSKMLTQITEDNLGYLWCGTRDGVFRTKLEDLRRLIRKEQPRVNCRLFTKIDGLPNSECSGPGCRARDGRIWFPTMDGVAILDPRRVSSNLLPPAVLLEEVRWDDQPVSGAVQDPQAAPLRLGPGRGRLELHYTGLNFTAPESVRFRHRLGGLDSDWVDAGSRRFAAYAYLPTGDYVFRVSACNEDGVWNDAGASLAFSILPHFWQTAWFGGGMLVLLLCAAIAVARVSAARRLRRQLALAEQQHALEQERRRIARDLHDDLGSGLTEVMLMGDAAAREATSVAEAKARTSQMTRKIRQIVGAMDQIVWTVNPENDSLPNLADYLSEFAQSFFQPTQIRCRLDVITGLPELPLTAQARHNLFLAVKEALHNVAKHSEASEVCLRIHCSPAELCLSVEDNGRGFDPAAEPAGHGLHNMRQRLAAIGGRAEILARHGQGACVRFYFPLPDPAGGPRGRT